MYEVHFLPWTNVGKRHDIGGVFIEPWSIARQCVTPNIRTYLDNYFGRYVANDGAAMNCTSVVYIGNNVVTARTAEQRIAIRRAVDALVFASILPQLRGIIQTANTSLGMPNSERFQVVMLEFKDMKEHVTVHAGGIAHVWPINQIHFCVPWHVGSGFYQTDEEITSALGKLLARKRHARLRERTFRALEWLRLAHTGSEEVSATSRAVMLATAFEVLFEPDNPFLKRGIIIQKLNTLTASPRLKVRSVKLGKTRQRVNVIAAWFNTFYQLRNRVVHGEMITSAHLEYAVRERPWLNHLHVAALVLWECILW